jgi:Domain of unknown function (DUF4293)
MIQRIQSIYLLLASICMGAFTAVPIATNPTALAASPMFSDAVYTAKDNTIVWILAIIVAVDLLVSIFLFKKRPAQRIVVLIANLFVLGVIGAALYFFMDEGVRFDLTKAQMSYGLALPVVALVLNYLAAAAIKKDDNLVKSMDRLR